MCEEEGRPNLEKGRGEYIRFLVIMVIPSDLEWKGVGGSSLSVWSAVNACGLGLRGSNRRASTRLPLRESVMTSG